MVRLPWRRYAESFSVARLRIVFCMTHSSWRSLSNGYMFSYCRTMLSNNNLSIASALLIQLSKSGLFNLKLCVASWSMQKVLNLFWMLMQEVLKSFLLHQLCLLNPECVAVIALLQTSQKALLESADGRIGIRHSWPWSKFWPCNLIQYVKTFGSFGLPGSFLPDITTY